MTAPQPPRWVVRLLESVGADPVFRDDVIGDMDEEFAVRLQYDGHHAARRWYVREAWRTFPFLVRDWARRLRGRDVAYLAGVASASYAVVVACAAVVIVPLEAVLHAMGIRLWAKPLPWNDPLFSFVVLPLLLLTGLGSAISGGYVAARIGRRFPLISAVAFGAFWCAISFSAYATMRVMNYGQTSPMWMVPIQGIVLISCTTLGGALRVWSTERDARPAVAEKCE